MKKYLFTNKSLIHIQIIPTLIIIFIMVIFMKKYLHMDDNAIKLVLLSGLSILAIILAIIIFIVVLISLATLR
jgi:hypothetical protein